MVSVSDLNPSQKKQNNLSSPTSTLHLDHPNDRGIYPGMIRPKNFPDLPENWTSEWEKFPGVDGKVHLYSVLHHAKDWKSPRTLVVLHGLGEHGGRYFHFPHFMKDTVDAVYCIDHRGHGRSEGIRGYVETFDQYADDAILAIRRLDEKLKQKFGKSEIHLLGHSMGGLIALRVLDKDQSLPLHSVTVSAPLLGIAVQVPVVKKWAGHLLSRVWGSIQMTSEINPNDISHDPAVVEAYVTDRLVHNKVTPAFFTSLLTTLDETSKREFKPKYPLQMLIPLQDRIVDANASLSFYRELKLKDKRLTTYPEFYHEPFNEVEKEKAFEDLKSWIKSHSTS